MTKKQERHIVATIGTILFLVLLFLLLWYMRLSTIAPEQEEGVEVAFGEVEEAGGYMAEESEAVPLPASQPVETPPAAPSNNDLITSENEEALALQKAREAKEKADREKAEAERRQKEKEAAERKAKEDAAIAKASQMGSLFGNSGNTTGSGDGQGTGQKGNPIGHGSSGGNNWSLAGRSIKGTLPQPSDSFKQEGKVVVQIRVNAAGQVIDARETAGGNISDRQTIQLALEAARKAQFTEGDRDQIGTITYIFKFTGK